MLHSSLERDRMHAVYYFIAWTPRSHMGHWQLRTTRLIQFIIVRMSTELLQKENLSIPSNDMNEKILIIDRKSNEIKLINYTEIDMGRSQWFYFFNLFIIRENILRGEELVK